MNDCPHLKGKAKGHRRVCVECGDKLSARCNHCGRVIALHGDGNLFTHGGRAGCEGSLSFDHDAPDAAEAAAVREAESKVWAYKRGLAS